MPRITLATYAVRLHAKYDPGQREILSSFGPEGTDLLDVIEAYVESLERRPLHDDRAQAVMRLDRVTRTGPTVSGRLLSGGFGYTAELVDVETLDRRYGRRTADAELVPLYFSIAVPRRRWAGVAVFQRFGNTGMRSMFTNGLNSYFAARFPDYTLTINPQLPREVLDALLQGGLRGIEMITYKVPRDITDAVRTEEYDTEEAYLVSEIKARRGSFLRKPKWLRDLANGRVEAAEIPEHFDADFDVLKVHVDYNGTVRTVDFSRLDRIRPYVDVTREVTIADGHPTFDTVHRLAQDMSREMLRRMGYDEDE